MTGGAEAAFQRNLRQRQQAVAQQFFRPLQSHAHYKLMWRQAGVMFEHAGKVVFAQPGLRRQIRQQQRRVEMLFDILFHSPGYRRCQATAYPRQSPLQLAVALNQMRHQ